MFGKNGWDEMIEQNGWDEMVGQNGWDEMGLKIMVGMR